MLKSKTNDKSSETSNNSKFLDVFSSLFKNSRKKNFSNKDRETTDALLEHDKKSMRNHNYYYDTILREYSNGITKSLEIKTDLKKDFYSKCINIIIGLIFLQVFIILTVIGCYYHNVFIPEEVSITIAVSSIGTLITSFIALPIIIAKYLFNPNEERNVMQVIKNIQKHDVLIRKKISKK